MIDFPIEAGVLCWASTLIFLVAVVVAIWKIVKTLTKK